MSHYFILFIFSFALFFGLLDSRPYNQSRSFDDVTPSLPLDGNVYSGEATYYDRM
jgi:hypothetical protein